MSIPFLHKVGQGGTTIHWFNLLISAFAHIPLVLGYIRSQAFEQPLPLEKEQALLVQMHAGDDQARHLLIEHNMRLVAHIAKKYTNKQDDLEDYISIGAIGLLKAVSSYTPEKKTKLSTYAARCIENEILMHLRKIKKQKQEVSLQEQVGHDVEGAALTLADLLQSQEPHLDEQILHKDLTEHLYLWLQDLDSRELEIIQKRYGLFHYAPVTQISLAEEMGISRSYVSRIEKRALVKLYKLMKSRTSH